MSPAARSARRALAVGAAVLALSAAAADRGADLERCASIAAADARLACYDALAHRPPDPPTSAAAPPPVAAAKPAARPSPTATGGAAADFGRAPPRPSAAPDELESIQASVAKITSDQVGHVYLLLDNGQTWTFTDTDARLEPGDPVTIKRGAFGSFTMTTSSRHTYKVRRTQ